jgi:5S rRNA maturation endonuclease (ribonuclease M5)
MSKNRKYFDMEAQSYRFKKASKIIKENILRNKSRIEGGSNCPILVEGINDVKALRSLGFTGVIEKLNRGYSRSKLIAYLYETYGTRNKIDGKSSIIILMDWDKTGKSIQNFFRIRLMSMDMAIDEEMHNQLSILINPEIMAVEELSSYASIFSSKI